MNMYFDCVIEIKISTFLGRKRTKMQKVSRVENILNKFDRNMYTYNLLFIQLNSNIKYHFKIKDLVRIHCRLKY